MEMRIMEATRKIVVLWRVILEYANNGAWAEMGLDSRTSRYNMNQDGANGLTYIVDQNKRMSWHICVWKMVLISWTLRARVIRLPAKSRAIMIYYQWKSMNVLTFKSVGRCIIWALVIVAQAFFPMLSWKPLQKANRKGLKEPGNRTRNPGLEAEAAPSGFRYPEWLHHVPIELMNMEDPLGVSVPQGNPNSHTEAEPQNSRVGQVYQGRSGFGWEAWGLAHVTLQQNGKPNATKYQCSICLTRIFWTKPK